MQKHKADNRNGNNEMKNENSSEIKHQESKVKYTGAPVMMEVQWCEIIAETYIGFGIPLIETRCVIIYLDGSIETSVLTEKDSKVRKNAHVYNELYEIKGIYYFRKDKSESCKSELYKIDEFSVVSKRYSRLDSCYEMRQTNYYENHSG